MALCPSETKKRESNKFCHFWGLRFTLLKDGFTSHGLTVMRYPEVFGDDRAWEFQLDECRHLKVVQTDILDSGQTAGCSRHVQNRISFSLGLANGPNSKAAWLWLTCQNKSINLLLLLREKNRELEVHCRLQRENSALQFFNKNRSWWHVWTLYNN